MEISFKDEFAAAKKAMGRVRTWLWGGWGEENVALRTRDRWTWERLKDKVESDPDLRRRVEGRERLAMMDLRTEEDYRRGAGFWGQMGAEGLLAAGVIFGGKAAIHGGGVRVGEDLISLPEQNLRITQLESWELGKLLYPGEVRYLAEKPARLAVAEKMDLNEPTKNNAFSWLESRQAIVNLINKMRTTQSRKGVCSNLLTQANWGNKDQRATFCDNLTSQQISGSDTTWNKIKAMQRLELWIQVKEQRDNLRLRDNMSIENYLSFAGTPVNEGGLGWNSDDKDLVRAIYYLDNADFKGLINRYNQKYNKDVRDPSPIPIVP